MYIALDKTCHDHHHKFGSYWVEDARTTATVASELPAAGCLEKPKNAMADRLKGLSREINEGAKKSTSSTKKAT